ncbi:MAG: HAMP domain-containing sensor histidine kinase, partial [Solirubrobacteraceae bacterium]
MALPARYGVSALTPGAVARAVKRPLLLDTRPPGSAQTFRVYARSIPAPRGRREVALVAISLAGRDAALAGLLRVLLIAGPAALLLAVAGAYVLAAAALRPVSSMSRRAMSISSASAGERLPVPPARDEIARLGESLNEMLDRLEAAARHERAFVADASHELRTPLGVIKTELELAMTSGRSPQELRAALASIAEENDRTVALADGLLFLAHADEKRLPLRVQRLAVGEIFEDLRERYRQRLRDRRGLLAIEPTVGIYVCADRLRITQALTNLIDNALKYGDGEVCLMADATESGVRLHVQDHGSGFPKAFLPRAFDRFARASAGLGGADGTGLGLAIVKAIAEAHGGDAHAANG